MSEYKPYNYDFKPSACMRDLSWGCKANWYIHENVASCVEEVPARRVGNKSWPNGWFATVKYINHDDMRDSCLNAKCERIISGPFPSKEAALAEAESRLKEAIAELS